MRHPAIRGFALLAALFFGSPTAADRITAKGGDNRERADECRTRLPRQA